MSRANITEGMDQLQWICNLLQTENFEFWADSGTLLGLVREGGLLDSDPDIDISLVDTDGELQPILTGSEEFEYDLQVKKYRGEVISYKIIPENDNLRQLDIKVVREGTGKDGVKYYWCPVPMVESPLPDMTPINTLFSKVKKVVQFFNRSTSGEIEINSLLLRPIVTIGTFLLPRDQLESFEFWNSTNIRIPQMEDAYLSYRFGDWRTPAEDWYYWEDDNAIVHKKPEYVLE